MTILKRAWHWIQDRLLARLTTGDEYAD